MRGPGSRGSRLARLLHRVPLRTQSGSLRPLWAAAYAAAARAVAAHLRRASPGSAVYVRGALGEGEAIYGLSDIDLVAVVPDDRETPGARSRSVAERWLALRGRFPLAGELVDVAVYEDAELADATEAPTPVFGLDESGDRAAYFGPGARSDPSGLRERPGLGPPMRTWRRLAGPERRPPVPTEGRDRTRIAAWLELQRWWGYAAEACADPGRPGAAHLCFKLVAEPLRAWLWLAHGEVPPTRLDALRRGLVLVPEEADAIGFALDLRRRLPGAPAPPFGAVLPVLLRLTERIAGHMASDVAGAGATAVALAGGAEDELALGMDALRGARSLPGADAPPLPLVDWRALVVVPAMPDETFMPVGGYAGDADTFAATAAASAVGTYPVLTGDGVTVQPSADPWRRGMLRAVQSPLTDPVSFALARGETAALYPRVGGWSVHDIARRAVAEHRGFLAGPGRRPIGAFRAFAMLFTAARAALLHESLAAERPELLLTVSAVAGRLADRAGPRRAAVEAAHEAYRAGRPLEDAPARDLVAPLSEVVRDLPAYTPAAASGRVAAVA